MAITDLQNVNGNQAGATRSKINMIQLKTANIIDTILALDQMAITSSKIIVYIFRKKCQIQALITIEIYNIMGVVISKPWCNMSNCGLS